MVSLVAVVLFGLGWLLLEGQHIAVLMPSGEIAEQQRSLMIFTVLLALIVVVPVFVLLAAFAWKFREGNPRAKHQPEWGENTWLELVWWGIPIAIIGVLGATTYVTSHSLDPYRAIESEKAPLEVQVVALQWKWLFIYPEQHVASINDLTIPVDRPVHFSLSADAPMSAFWIPDLGSQIYSMNSMNSQLNLIANHEGTFTGYNTNINGDGYSDMKFQVHAVGDQAFADWADAAHASDRMLTYAMFEELAKPGVPEVPTYYMLHEADLYQRIVQAGMSGQHKSNESSHGGAH